MSFESQLLQLLFAGLTLGSIYALIALGFVTIHNVTGIVNFAQGDFAMLGALITVTLYERTPLFNRVVTVDLNWPLPLAALVAIIITTAIGVIFYLVAIRPARGASVISLIIITIGASITLRGLGLIVWWTDPYPLPAFTPGPPLEIGGAIVTRQNLWVMGTTLAIVVGLYLFFEHTLLGKALRACAINRDTARLMGISADRMALFSFALGAAVSAIAGIVITPTTFMAYDSGTLLSLKGFVAAIMGGLVSPPLAVIGGLVLGLVEAFGAGLLSSAYKDAFAFMTLFIILLLRVGGFFGQRAAEA
ncbi:MAG: branched-chain amino acid ABC transporter permease [Chloroflexi bacterium]|nr:MAG: branched-chain amino acid ABC transporter permease [Chloroflexota bacterium]